MLSERLLNNHWYSRTTQDLFAEVCEKKPDQVALVFDDTTTTFDQLRQQVNQVAQGLIKLGVGKGDVVATLPSPTPEFVAVYFATLQIGAIVNPLNLLWGVLEFRGVLPRNNPKVIVTVDEYGGRNYLDTLREALPDLITESEGVRSALVPALSRLVCVSRRPDVRHQGCLGFSDLLTLGDDWQPEDMRQRIRSAQPTDIQFMCQTSGTTGLSKSALWDHRSPLATVSFGARNLGYTESDSYINLSPFYHNSGLFGLNLTLALSGTTLYLMEQFRPELALCLIDRHKITTTFGFDSHWQGLRRVPGFEQRQFTICKAVLAGEPRTYDLVKAMCPEGASINNLYAQTENGPLVSLAERDCMNYNILKFTHGRPLPGVEVMIKDLETQMPVAQGQPGEICYRSPFLFRGYHQQPDETAASFDEQGYFHSGDYGSFGNGYITFLGRLGGVLKTGGENVSTVRVANLLLELFADDFDDVKAIGVPDDYWGSKLVCLVRPAAGRSLASTRELRDTCKGTLAIYEIPQAFLLWEGEWPVSPEGKVDFRKLEQEALARLAQA